MNYQNWTEEQKAAYILDALSREDIPSDLLVLIQGWILSDDSAEGKDKELDAMLDRLFDEKPLRSEQQTRESLARLHERIGLPSSEPLTEKRIPLRRTLFRVAAVVVPLLVLAGGALWFVGRHVSDPVPIVATTEGGDTEESSGKTERKTATDAVREVFPGDDGRLTLPDGSTVRLTGDSHITIAENFTENRFVELSGEAFFSVTKDPDRPFVVNTEQLTVTVLGTEFNLEAYSGMEEAVVSLASGRVEVADKRGTTVLAPMEQLTYSEETGVSAVEEFEPEQIDRWRFGEQVLDGLSLEEALRAVADFYGNEIVIEGVLSPDTDVTTILKDDMAAESALEALRLMSGEFTWYVGEDTIYIY